MSGNQATVSSILVQKFGGTSVATTEKIKAAARKAIRAQKEGKKVVMVVSAMGKNTDVLVGLAGEISEDPPAREMDMLLSTGEQVSVALMAMAIHELGSRGVSLTGGQIGIRTDSIHTKARIQSISTERMQRLLDDGNIVIAAGFQGIDEEFNITTLGRGGSDTTAVALAAVLNADACEIYTDVDGVYTTDPRIIPEARRVAQISYNEMLELASLGAGVMHSRSIEFGKKFGVPIHVRNSGTDAPGTMIVDDPEVPDQSVSGCAVTKDEARVTVSGVPDVPGTSYEIFSRIAKKNITVDMIVQNIGEDGKADISFTVPRNELKATLEAVSAAHEAIGDFSTSHDDAVSKVSAVGLGMAHQTGVAEAMFAAIARAGINLQMITTSEIKISALVSRAEAVAALRAIHETFELHREPASRSVAAVSRPRPRPLQNAADVVAHLQGAGMEQLTIDDVALDATQGSVTVAGIPDRPGVAASVFHEVARAGIIVDMIVQSYGAGGKASLSFTVPRPQVDTTVALVRSLNDSFPWKEVKSSPHVAKLSVSGIGLRSHTGVAIRMFRALRDAGINVEMISTSEVRVNVVVDGSKGEAAQRALQSAFADVMH
jgi:aspartate kinase